MLADNLISGYVGHHESSTPPDPISRKYKKYFKTYPVSFARPETGETVIADTCRVCGQKLEFKVRSKSAVRILKLTLRVSGVLGVALGIISFIHRQTGDLPGMQAVLPCLTLFSFFGGLGALAYSFMDRRLALKMKAKGTEHELFSTIDDKPEGTSLFGATRV